MGQRIDDLVARFEQANTELVATVEGLSDEQWATQCGSEDQRSVGVVADHVAASHVPVAQWVQSIAAGQPSSVSMETIHEVNAQHAAARANATRAEVTTALRENGQQAVDILRGLNEDELDRTVPMALMGGQEVSAAQVAEMILIGHISSHMNEIRSAAGA